MDLEFENNISNDLKKGTVFSIDRFEGNFAVCENLETQEMINIDRSLLPQNCVEGSIIKFEDGKYILDIDKTQQKQEEIRNLVNNLFKK